MRAPIGVIGAGPAGLTSAWELQRLGQPSVVFEADPRRVGGLARTEEYKGFRFDIGGHRFFSKNAEIRALWRQFLPPADLLTVARTSRIYYGGKFFDYPLQASNVLRQLGVIEAARSGLSYLAARARPGREQVTFEDWVVARFGRRLYERFFKTYTEKVWGIPCDEISADFAAQRIKGLSFYEAVKQMLVPNTGGQNVKSLIEQFEYPRLGPGMMWEHVTEELATRGVPVQMASRVRALHHRDGELEEITVRTGDDTPRRIQVSGAVSSMPLRSLVFALDPPAPEPVRQAAGQLHYRDFLVVALILDIADVFPDNWIYIHDPSVKVGRVQNFKNWSPDMVPDMSRTALGLEYFCFQDDDLWRSSDDDLLRMAARELEQLGLAPAAAVVDGVVVRMPKAYPVYDDSYRRNVELIREYVADIAPNLQLCGRNGMHKYNNQDHAMMTGLMAARNLAGEEWDQWLVNEDAEYHETLRPDDAGGRLVPTRVPARR